MRSVLIGLLLLSFSVPAIAAAQGTWSPSDQIVPKTCDGPNCTCKDLIQLANNVQNFSIYFLVIMSSFLFLLTGFRFLNNRDNPIEMAAAKNLLLNVLIGLVLAIGAYLIVSTIISSLSPQKNTTIQALITAMGCK